LLAALSSGRGSTMNAATPTPVVLLVDDDRALCTLARRKLERENLTLVTLHTGRDAIAWLDANEADLVLLDLFLPDMKGQDLLDALAARKRDVPFVVMTGYGDERVAVDIMKKGALDYLAKNVALPEFLPSVVRNALDRLAEQRRLATAESALRERQEAERQFMERLTVLHAVTNELMDASSFDELCRKAVELGRTRLGFDRIGIWFLTPDGTQMEGSFGTDEQGRIRDERGQRVPMDKSQVQMLTTQPQVEATCGTNVDLADHLGHVVGKGDIVWTAISDGRKLIGSVCTDNLLSRRPFTKQDTELFVLFANSLGHLCALKRTEAEIRKLNEELEQRVRERTAELMAVNKELEAFCYSVSHDLRAPLRAIDGFSRAVYEDHGEELSEEARSYLSRVCAASERMARLIDDLLQLSRMTRTEMHRDRVNLTDMLKSIARDLRAEQPDRQAEFVILDDMFVYGDARLLQIAMENLLENAWKFTGQRPIAHIECGVIRENKHLIHFVKDDGAGFDMAYAGKLFGAFQRLHAATDFPGTGIGLATVQRIIHRHGGQIWAEGRVGEGAVFYFTLPSTGLPDAAEANRARLASPAGPG